MLDRFRESQIAQMSALALGFSAMFRAGVETWEHFHDSDEKKQKGVYEEVYEQRKKDHIDSGKPVTEFKGMPEGYDASVIIPNSERTLVYIEQKHGFSSLQKLEDQGILAETIVAYQKQLEGLLLWLKNEKHIEVFSSEGVFAEELQLLHDIQESYDALTVPQERLDFLTTVAEKGAEDKQLSEKVRAWILYKISRNVQLALEKITPEIAQDPEQANYRSQLESTLRRIQESKFLKEDRIYAWGAPMKLFLDGKINIQAAESAQVHQETYDVSVTAKEMGVSDEEFLNRSPELTARIQALLDKKWNNRQEKREAVAIEMTTSRPDQRYYPLVFGGAHSFHDDIERHNATHPERQFGYIRIMEEEGN